MKTIINNDPLATIFIISVVYRSFLLRESEQLTIEGIPFHFKIDVTDPNHVFPASNNEATVTIGDALTALEALGA